jgi:hypothetical protein
MACTTEINLCARARGDTYAIVVQLTDGDVAGNPPIDITGWSFLLTVDPSPDPADALSNLFQLVGTIVDAPNGKVRFGPLSAPQADQEPGTYYYDVQATNTVPEIRTVLRGEWPVVQDITK